MKIILKRVDSRQLDESDYRSKNDDNVLRLWNSTLQILLPVAALAVIWGRRGLFTRFLLQFDKNCISVLCPSLNDKERLLNWINNYVSTKWFYPKDSAVNTPIEFWENGYLLCSLINTAIPGACPNPHRHWQQPPSHGQALAYKYLGVAPVFTERELTMRCLTEHQQNVLERYINTLQQAVSKVSLQDFKFSSTYIAKGMGLVSGEQYRKMFFYIYANAPTLNNEDIAISIKAPYNIYQTLNIPSYNIPRKLIQKPFTKKQNLYYKNKAQRFLSRTSSLDLGTHYNQTKQDCDNKIPITFTIENERIKVVYIPQHAGIYELSIITNGFHILGSPFPVSILESTSNVIDCLDETDSMGNSKKVLTKKIVSEVIDFVDKKVTKERSTLAKNTLTHATITEEDDEINEEYYLLDSENDLENSDHLTSPICISHIESEVGTALEPFLVPKENQSKGESKRHALSKTNSWDTAFDSKHTDTTELRISSKNNSKFVSVDNKEKQNYSLNILNYLSHFKLDQSQLFSHLPRSLSNSEIHSCKDFKNRLQFWEIKLESNLNELDTLKQRHSMPDIHGIYFEDKQLSKFTSNLDIINNHPKHEEKIYNFSRLSLPDILTNIKKVDLIETQIDEYMVGLEFRNKFKRCLEYWENLSSNSYSNETLSLKESKNDYNLGQSIVKSDAFYKNEYLYGLFAEAYNNATFMERREFWERISSLSLDEINPEIDKETVVTKSELIKVKQEMLNSVVKLNCIKNDRHNCITFEDDLESNLTDDVKTMKSCRENIKLKFNKNKEFFRSLESVIK